MAKSIFNSDDLAEIVSRIESLNEQADKKWGVMSVDQMLCHLADQLRMALGKIDYQDKSTFFSRTIVKYMAVYVVEAPPEKVQTLHELDQKRGGTAPQGFIKDKRILVELLNEILSLPENHKFKPHGLFGQLSRKEWGKLIYKHLDHHLKQFSN